MKWLTWLRQRFCSHPDTYTEWHIDVQSGVTSESYWECLTCGKTRGVMAISEEG